MTVINPNSISGITSITMPSGDGNVLTIHTNDGTERFRIDNSGNVKVGSAATISPDGNIFFTGVCTATTFKGNGANLTGIDTDLVSDTSPQLGGLLDGNGQTANFTANTTGLGIPRGTTAQEPTASSYEGYIRYNLSLIHI